MMGRFKIPSPLHFLALTAIFLSILIPQMECQTPDMDSQTWPRPRPRTAPLLHPRPLCSSQFALANYACARLPMNPEPIPIPPPPSPPDDDESRGHNHNHSHNHRHGHDHDHHDRDRDHDHDHDHHHGRSHSRSPHHHHHHHHYSAAVDDCCRWAKAVDSECICDVLVHLPNFLSRPSHAFTIAINEECVVTFSCGGRIKI